MKKSLLFFLFVILLPTCLNADVKKFKINKTEDGIHSQGALVAPAGSEIQEKFCRIISKYRKAYENETRTGNPLGKKRRLMSIFEKRNIQLAHLLSSGAIQGWAGRITKLSDVSSGAILVVELSCNALFKATPNPLIIPPDTEVYKALAQTKPNQQIRFSGTLFPRGEFPGGYPEFHAVAFHEDSFTQSGSMDEPEFLFRFDQINPY